MSQFWIGHNLMELWENWLSKEVYSKQTGKIILATLRQKEALKEIILEEKEGLCGWELVTRAEEKRRMEFLGEWELGILAKAYSPQENWIGADLWIKELSAFLDAGYGLDEIPFKGHWQSATKVIFEKLKDFGIKTTSLPWGMESFVVGFDPTQTWGIEKVKGIGLVAAREELSLPQMRAISVLEKRLGDAQWCESTAIPTTQATEVLSVIELGNAIKDILSSNKKIKRILWSGNDAIVAVRILEAEFEGLINFSPKYSLDACEIIKSFLQSQKGLATDALELLRENVVRGTLDWDDLKSREDKIKKEWEMRGTLKDLNLSDDQLPLNATFQEFSRITEKMLGAVASESLIRLASLERLLPQRFSKELWMEMITPPLKKDSFYGGIRAMPLNEAQGLLDASSLVVSTDPPSPAYSGITEEKMIRKLNSVNHIDRKDPIRGYLKIEKKNELFAWQSSAVKLVNWIGVGNGLPEGLTVKIKSYPYPEKTVFDAGIISKHRDRNNPSLPFGMNDYALPTPFIASCKQWEAIVTSPEPSWYELLKQKRLWRARRESPYPIWIGNWVHAALAEGTSLEDVDRFFINLKKPNASLEWMQAMVSAWGMARDFVQEIVESGAKTEAVEMAVNGILRISDQVSIELTGRIDRILRLPDDSVYIVDFKTGRGSKPVNKNNLTLGDGLQLWLYGRLWKGKGKVFLCRMPAGTGVLPQIELQPELIEPEMLMAKIFSTGILGQKGKVWGKFGGKDKLPLAAFPMDQRIIHKREEARV